jgi:hypothetical protein
MFNWHNCTIFDNPYPHIICDNFLQEYDDNLFPNEKWTKDNLVTRENDFTKALSAIASLESLPLQTKELLNNLLSQSFHDTVCKMLKINLVGESTGIRRTEGNYRIAREAQIVENSYTETNILEAHYDSTVTIWTGLLYFVNSDYGSFNIHDNDLNIVKSIPVRKNRMIITLNSNTTWHSVSPWLESTTRKSIYTTAEFKNFGRDKDRNPIGAKEVWIKEN